MVLGLLLLRFVLSFFSLPLLPSCYHTFPRQQTTDSGFFKKQELWKNAVTYTTRTGRTYGLLLNIRAEEHNELVIFFDRVASEEMRFLFEEYVQEYLLQHMLPNSIQRKRFFACPSCGDAFTDKQVMGRRERGFDLIRCSVCETSVSILDGEERLTKKPGLQVSEMNRIADNHRDHETSLVSLQGKIATMDFDVFLCYNNKDKSAVKQIGERLKAQGILPWFDEWELRPGLPWQRTLEEQIQHVKSAAVFVGEDGIGPWEQLELEALLRQFVKRKCPVIPVILADATMKPQLPVFLEGMTWIDFHKQVPDPMEQLIWGITGKRP